MAAGIFLCTGLLISDSAHERPAAFFNLEMRRSAFTRRRPIGRPEGVWRRLRHVLQTFHL